MEDQGRHGYHVDGIGIVGFHSREEVKKVIEGDKELQAKGAIPFELLRKEKTFLAGRCPKGA